MTDERICVSTTALPVPPALSAVIADYAAAVRDHTSTSEALLSLAALETERDALSAAGRRVIAAEERRNRLARELADEVLTVLGVR